VSVGLAPTPPDIDRADSLADRLRSLAGVADARRIADWLLVVPRAAGVATLRRRGKAALVAEWRAALPGRDDSSGLQWRILESLPEAGSDEERRCLLPARSPLRGAVEFSTAGAVRCTLGVPLDLAVFEGHFQSIPVVPAVVQIGWAFEHLQAHLRPQARFAGIVSAKFRRLMRPGMPLTLALELSGERVHFEYLCQGSSVSAGRLLLETAHD
jgi:3-hydroxymyristoyl/3-hydroxydecanoyl-(acyl carrier protein) dehydratase